MMKMFMTQSGGPTSLLEKGLNNSRNDLQYTKSVRLFYVCIVVFVLFSSSAHASGISVDAGLTPAQNQWILRALFDYKHRHNDPTLMGRSVDRYTINSILAYGVYRNLTLILKLPIVHQEMMSVNGKHSDTGLADLLFTTKYSIYRVNTPQYTFGIAATLGLEFPTGMNVFSMNTFNMEPGVYLSWRRGSWASDLNIEYAWNGFADKGRGGIDPGNRLSLDSSLAYQFSLGTNAKKSLTPVLEISYKLIFPDRLQGKDVISTGESVLYVSPGLKFTLSSFILEALVKIPAWQDQQGLQLKTGVEALAGFRYMF